MKEKQTLLQTLADAGCDDALAERLALLLEQGRKEEALALLARHRKILLGDCHGLEKRIGCLDYLVYQIGRKQKVLYERNGDVIEDLG